MNIVLDTNIFQKNFSLKTSKFDALISYLRKTDDKLFVPFIVGQELIRNYKGTTDKAFGELEVVERSLKRCIINEQLENIANTLYSFKKYNSENIDKNSIEYLNYIKSTIKNVIIQEELPSLDFNRVVMKGLNKQKPFKASGEGMKDAILWESIIDHCKINKLERIIFISENSHDFGRERLESSLLDQMKEDGLTIIYYNSLQSFIENEFATVKDIEFKISDIDLQTLKILLDTMIFRQVDLKNFYNKHSTSDNIYKDFQGIFDFEVSQINDFIVKDINSDFKLVNAQVTCKVGMVVLHESYSPQIDSSGDYDINYSLDYEVLPTLINLDLTLKLINDKFEDLQLNSALIAE
ncbi:PIN domain-containing protein [Pedobacter duraquae]|uniref:Uncharacterized protein DUF4935 n=1 Tax=Pedobacter duraquae TaxID=425511 RepID=A0A4R6IK97_9SPHI|nr:PIN domain-containing protein [Pedobacter duraquae]TDO22366.1 uncharacterized protein DUF4935 [Pedobacter duraquae]